MKIEYWTHVKTIYDHLNNGNPNSMKFALRKQIFIFIKHQYSAFLAFIMKMLYIMYWTYFSNPASKSLLPCYIDENMYGGIFRILTFKPFRHWNYFKYHSIVNIHTYCLIQVSTFDECRIELTTLPNSTQGQKLPKVKKQKNKKTKKNVLVKHPTFTNWRTFAVTSSTVPTEERWVQTNAGGGCCAWAWTSKKSITKNIAFFKK